MPALEERIQDIEDRDAIRELTARYCHAVVEANVDAIVELFCEDGAMVMGETRNEGQDALRRSYGDALADLTPKPMIHNHVIELAGNTATGRCSVELRFVENGEAFVASGHYDDHYRREGSAWKFARRDFTVYHWVPNSKGWS